MLSPCGNTQHGLRNHFRIFVLVQVENALATRGTILPATNVALSLFKFKVVEGV